MECLYTVYVPFLPQHYRDQIKRDSLWEEERKNNTIFPHYEFEPCFRKRDPMAAVRYINERLTYDPTLLGDQKEARGVYIIKIDSYGEITECKTFRSCGIAEWDIQVEEIIKGMPHWIPAGSTYGKGHYSHSAWVVPVIFKNEHSESPEQP